MLNREDVEVTIELTGVNRLCCECKNAPEGCEYAFYIYKNGKIIDRLSYQKEARYVYWLTEPGEYAMKVYVQGANEKTSKMSDGIRFEGHKPIYCNISPRKRPFDWLRNVLVVLKELWIHRKRMLRISLFDYRVLNKDAYLGNIWNILSPLIQIATYWFVFGIGIRNGRDVEGHPYLVWMLCGMIPWFFASPCIVKGAGAIRSKGIAVLKMRYPVVTTPLEQIMVQLYSHLVMTAILLITLICMGYWPNLYWLNLIYYFFYAIVFFTSLAMVTSVFSMIALDFQKLVASLIRLLFYMTPILWSMEMMPPYAQRILQMNPVLYYVNGFRDSLLFKVPFYAHPQEMAFFWGINVLLFVWGCNLLVKYKDQFIDLQ